MPADRQEKRVVTHSKTIPLTRDMKTIKLHIISPTGELFNGETQRVLLPGRKAPFVVLPMHAPLISSLTRGVICYTEAGGCSHTIEVAGGFVEVCDDVVRVCTE